jgi:hypothetical protein
MVSSCGLVNNSIKRLKNVGYVRINESGRRKYRVVTCDGAAVALKRLVDTTNLEIPSFQLQSPMFARLAQVKTLLYLLKPKAADLCDGDEALIDMQKIVVRSVSSDIEDLGTIETQLLRLAMKYEVLFYELPLKQIERIYNDLKVALYYVQNTINIMSRTVESFVR